MQRYRTLNTLIKRLVNNRFQPTIASYSTESSEPVKYSASPASGWKAADTRRGVAEDDTPEIQTYSVTLSMAIFMIYFFYLREESDVDAHLSTTLYDRIDGLEESQLRVVLKYKSERGEDTTDIRKRLMEIQSAKE